MQRKDKQLLLHMFMRYLQFTSAATLAREKKLINRKHMVFLPVFRRAFGYFFFYLNVYTVKVLMIPNGYSEAVNRRTDNTMAKEKGQSVIYKILHEKLRIEQHEPR